MGANSSHIANLQRKEATIHIPTCDDVFIARGCLLTKVPAELANKIIDDACYWPRVSRRHTTDGRYLMLTSDASTAFDATSSILLSPRLADWTWAPGIEGTALRIKRVCFRISSHDQGFTLAPSNGLLTGNYGGSSTWFEAAIVRRTEYDEDLHINADDTQIKEALNARTYEEKPRVTTVRNPCGDGDEPDVWHIQTNKRGCRHTAIHEVSWTEENDGFSDAEEAKVFEETGSKLGRGFVRALESGDRVAIIARAMYPGWSNHVGSVDLEVYYSV